MQHIVEKNNAGVVHMRNGRYKEAKKQFKTALIFLAVFHKRYQDKGFEERPTTPIQIETTILPESSDPSSYSHSYYLHQHAYLAYMDQQTSISEEEVQQSTLLQNSCCMTVLVTFNLSLATHLKLDRYYHCEDRETSPLLRRSLSHKKCIRFYTKAWEALRLAAMVMPRRQAFREHMVLAILNNTGVMYFYGLCCYRKANYCLESLKNILSADVDNTTIQELSPEVRKGLMMNIFLLEDKFENFKELPHLRPMVE